MIWGKNSAVRMLLSRLGRNESGAAMLEYTVLLGLILIAAIGAVIFAGEWVDGQWAALESALSAEE